MSEIPIISVTKEDPDESSDSERSEIDIRDALTDVEDLDDSENKGLKVFTKTRKAKTPATTDVEDYVDSSSEQDEKDVSDCNALLSLTEFLEQGVVESCDGAANKITTTTSQKRSSLLAPFFYEDQGAVTDCEDYNSSGDEVSEAGDIEEIEISAYLPECDKVEILDNACDRQDSEKEEDDEENDISVSEAGDMCNPGEASEAEDMAFSEGDDKSVYQKLCADVAALTSKEEVIQNESTDEMPASGTNNATLQIPEIQEDTLTDTERVDMDSDAELVENASNLAVGPPQTQSQSPRSSLTDIEDIDIGEMLDLSPDPQQVSPADLPAPVREITIVRSDASGQRITSTMPLQGNQSIAIENFDDEKGNTDTEDISADEEFFETENIEVIEEIPKAYLELAKNTEVIKDMTGQKEHVHETEPITDVEEIFMPGTARRKKSYKSKTKKPVKPKSQEKDVDVTDIEEFEDSDTEPMLNKFENTLQVPSTSTSGKRTPDMKTDVESLSGDEEQLVSEDEPTSERVVDAINTTSFCSSETTIESIYQSGSPCKPREAKNMRKIIIEKPEIADNPNHTDIEDIHMTSDVEDHNLLSVSSYSRADTASPSELQNALNDCSVSIVHETCGRPFDIDKEKNHIKGLRDCPDSHTDIEFIEDENELGKEQNPPNN